MNLQIIKVLKAFSHAYNIFAKGVFRVQFFPRVASKYLTCLTSIQFSLMVLDGLMLSTVTLDQLLIINAS